MKRNFLFLLPLSQTAIFFSLETLKDAPLASLYSFLPCLVMGGLLAYFCWPQGEGRISRLLQDLILSFGLGFFFFLIVNAFHFLVIALGAQPNGIFSKLLTIVSIFSFWGVSIVFFTSQKNKAQFLGMNWVHLEHDQSGLSKEYATFDEIQGALNLFNLEPDITMEELKNRYRELCLLYHPDRLSGMNEKTKESAQKEFQRIQNAFEIIEEALKSGKI